MCSFGVACGGVLLWRVMNDKIFSAEEVDAEVLFDKIQITSWKWLVAKKINAPCLFYECCRYV
jgi:hypothetical protein